MNLFAFTFACQIDCDYDCCRTGCYATEFEVKRIRQNFDKIQRLMDSDVRDKIWHKLSWSALSRKSPFTCAILTRIREKGSKTCVFHRISDRKCAVHLHNYDLKPLHCRLSPFVSLHALYLRNELAPETWHKKCKGFGRGKKPVLEIARKEFKEILNIKSFSTREHDEMPIGRNRLWLKSKF